MVSIPPTSTDRKPSTPAADGGDDRYLTLLWNLSRESASVADIFIPNKDIDMLADLILLVEDAVADARIFHPQRS